MTDGTPRASFSVELARPIDAALAADVEKQAAYVSPAVLGLRVTRDLRRVEVEVDAGADSPELRATVQRFLDAMIDKFRKLPQKELARRARAEPHYEAGVFAELVRRGWVKELGRGQVGLAGPALALVNHLDAACARLGKERFGAVAESYPALIPADVLARCGYFASFPQAVSFVTHLLEDFDVIEEFREANADADGLTVPYVEALVMPEACLTPAVCYHLYPSLEGKTLGSEGVTVTSVGRCFRYEARNIVGLDRLWDFTMREVIFVGTERWVAERRERAIEAAAEMLAAWDLDGAIETANDPFFPSTYAAKTYWQQRGDLKFELRLGVEPDAAGPRAIAASSFNLHQDFFGRTFGITASDGAPAFTGCVGWGLERWALAAFSQHGYERSRWPDALRLVFD